MSDGAATSAQPAVGERDPLFDLAGQLVVITGGLGQLGRQFTSAVMDRGGRVAIVDCRDDADAVASIPGANESSLRSFVCDLTDRESVVSASNDIVAHFGDVPTGLINNAALDSPPNAPASETGPFEEYPTDSWRQVIDVNLTGTFHACQVFGKAMADAGRGSIINVSSIYGVVSPNQSIYEFRRQQTGQPFFKPVAYSASKSGVMNLTRYLATYWASQGVRVNTVTFAGVFNQQDPAFLDAYCKHIPIGRMANPDEYNGTIVYLLSSASAYMTGSNVVIDGGWTAW